MKKQLFLGLLISTIMVRPLTAQFNFSDVQFWTGNGSDSTLLVVDFNDGSGDSSYVWGYAYNTGETGEDLLNAIAAADLNFQVNIAGGFLNDVIYGQHEGLAGMPDYWSTWSGADTASLAMNSGISTALVDGEWFALSYTDFTPALKPGLPIPAFNPQTFDFSMLDQWLGTGSDSMALFIDFQFNADSGRIVFGYLFNDSIQASQVLSDLDQNLAGLSVNAQAFLNDITYNNWSGIGGQPNFWSTWSGSNVGNWYMNAGISTYVKANEIFGCSYTDFTPALRPRVPASFNAIGLQNTALSSIEVYPNPSSDYIMLQFEGDQAIEVINMQGQVIYQAKANEKHRIDVLSWKRGWYVLKVGSESKVISLL
ncbi:MAG: T9SS type A sorting domain-containing protein [Bacteroidetes bacterium]|nr:T9SS type A sorting domain-containing protein [Bacteroidota bacterium]